MGKYRITSVPQSLPKKQFGGNKLKNFIYARLHPRDKKTTPVDDQPMVEVEGMQGQPSYWNDMELKCPPGKYPYNGDCVTEAEYIAIKKMEDDLNQSNLDKKRAAYDVKQKEFDDIIKSSQEQRDKWYKEDVIKYYDDFEKSAKGDKIKPFDSLPAAHISKEAEEELKKQFLIHKNEKGFVDLYPKDLVYKRVVDNGFQAEQFKKYWGLDPKQVESQIGDLMKAADEQYTQDVTQHVVNKAINEGKTTDEIISGLSPKVGTKSGLKKKFAKPTQKIIDDAYSKIKEEILSGIPGVDQTKFKKDEDVFFSNDPQTAWENKYRNANLGEFLDYQGRKKDRGTKAYNEYISKYGDVGQDIGLEYANKDDFFGNIRANNRMLQKGINLQNAAAARKSAENEEFEKAYSDYIGNYSANELKYVVDKMFYNSGADQKSKLKVLQELKTNPDRALQNLLDQKTGDDSKTYSDLLQDRVTSKFALDTFHKQNPSTIKPYKGVNENESNLSKFLDVASHPFDAVYYAMNPREEMWGDSGQSYRTRLANKKKYNLSAEEAGTMPFGPMSVFNWTPAQAFNPFKIGSNLRRGYDEGRFTESLGDEIIDMGTTLGFAKGLNAISGAGLGLKKGLGTLARSTFSPLADIGFGIKAGTELDEAIEHIKKGEYGSAAEKGAYGVLDALPLIHLNKYLKGFNKFDNTGGFNFNKPFNNTNQLNYNPPKLLNTQQTPKYNLFDKDGQLLYNQYQDGGVHGDPPPLYIIDPEEYAYRQAMYDDSLSLYNAYKFQKMNLDPTPILESYVEDYNRATDRIFDGNRPTLTVEEQKKIRTKNFNKNIPKVNKKDYKETKADPKGNFSPMVKEAGDYKVYDYYKNQDYNYPIAIGQHSSPDIFHSKILPVRNYFDGIAYSPVYKKPTQPVTNQKPFDLLTSDILDIKSVNPTSTNTNNPITNIKSEQQQQALNTSPYRGRDLQLPWLYGDRMGLNAKYAVPLVNKAGIKQTVELNEQGEPYIRPSFKHGGNIYAHGGSIINSLRQLGNKKDGGSLPEAQKGKTVEPIYISDPKEYAYRKQMYDDSLFLNQSYPGIPKYFNQWMSKELARAHKNLNYPKAIEYFEGPGKENWNRYGNDPETGDAYLGGFYATQYKKFAEPKQPVTNKKQAYRTQWQLTNKGLVPVQVPYQEKVSGDVWKDVKNKQPGYKDVRTKKDGGVVLTLSKKEINDLVSQGYVIEDQ